MKLRLDAAAKDTKQVSALTHRVVGGLTGQGKILLCLSAGVVRSLMDGQAWVKRTNFGKGAALPRFFVAAVLMMQQP